MTQELQTRIVGLLRTHGYIVAAFQLELETTELYLHTSGGNTVRSPLDTAAERIVQFRKPA